MPEEIIESYGLLPPKIQRTVDQSEGSGSQVVIGIRTTFRQNQDMPYCYLVVCRGKVLVCSSHKTRGVHRNVPFNELNSVDCSEQALRILVNKGDDLQLPIDATPETMQQLVDSIRKLKAAYWQ